MNNSQNTQDSRDNRDNRSGCHKCHDCHSVNDEKIKAIQEGLAKLRPYYVEQGRAETIWSIEDAANVERIKKLFASLLNE